MSLSTYSELKTAVANWLNRSDLTSLIPDFIKMAETRIHYGSQEAPFVTEPLRIRAMETSADVTIDAQGEAIPTGYLQARRFYINSSPIDKLDYVVPDVFWRTYISSVMDKPRRFTIEGENFVFGPTPDGTYTGKLLYYKKFDALSADGDTNWLLTNAPAAYLQGALLEGYKYIFDDAGADRAHKAFAGVVNGLNLADKADRYSGSPWTAFGDTGNP